MVCKSLSRDWGRIPLLIIAYVLQNDVVEQALPFLEKLRWLLIIEKTELILLAAF